MEITVLLALVPPSFCPVNLPPPPLYIYIYIYIYIRTVCSCFLATWVSRVPSEEELQDPAACSCLSPLQKEKFGHFFSHLLDWDKDSLISAQDFDALSEVIDQICGVLQP